MIFTTKTRIAAMLLAASMFAVPALASQTQVPNELIYEGRMLSKSGEVLSDEYVLRFSFWKTSDYTSAVLDSSGSIDTSLADYSGWSEILPVSFNELGHFSLLLGEVNSLEDFSFENFKYLQVEIKKNSEPNSAYQLLDINGDGGVDTTDRKMVASVPYARKSEVAGGSEGSTFVLDEQNLAEIAGIGNISLQFGGTLQEYLHYDIEADRFVLTGDLELQTDLITEGLVDGVDVSELALQVSQNAASILENAGNIAHNTSLITLAEAAIVQNAANILENAADITDAEADIIENATTILNTVNALTDAQTQIIEHTTAIATQETLLTELQENVENITNIHEGGTVSSETMIIDSDDTGGDITLQFGNTLNETLMWNATTEMFELSDDISVDGNIELTGTVDGVDVSDLSESVDTNITNIAGNTTAIANNLTEIIENATNITALDQSVLNAEADIINNAGDILDNTNDITQAQADIINNAADILENSTDINEAQADIINNAAAILNNTNDITQAQADIIDNAADILANTTDITAAQTDIINNAADILTNAADIAALEDRVALTEAGIINNAAEILANANDIEDLDDRLTVAEAAIVNNAAGIITNAGDIAGNTADITQAQADIINNAADILENSTDITQAQADILENAAGILENATDITQAQADIVSNADDISDLEVRVTDNESDIIDIFNDVGDLDFSGASYLTFGSNLTEALLELDDQIALNTAGIATNAGNIAGNTAAIVQNAAAIDAMDSKTGDTLYTSENVVESGDDLTVAVSKIDEYLGGTQDVSHQIDLGTASLNSDGTDNKMNVYQSLEEGGNYDYHFYKAVSKKATLQDIDTQFKVLMPKNFDVFNSISLSYKTDGASTDSALDITIADHNGNIADSSSALSSNSWASYSPSLSSSFAPAAGEYIYITVKAYSKDESNARFGDIVLNYSTQR